MCGIIGVLGTPHSAQEAYQGLLLMQHRGQDAAGILSYDFNRRVYNLHKLPGLVDKVFEKSDLQRLQGEMAIGHTRYSTIGHSDAGDIQPLMINFPFGIGLAHNGNLVNVHSLKKNLKEKKQRYIFTNNDAEVILNILAEGLASKCQTSSNTVELSFNYQALESAVADLYETAKGGYAVIGEIAGEGIFGLRDPHGIRPLILGQRELSEEEKTLSPNHFGKSYCFASESNTLNYLGYEIVRDVGAGELVYIDKTGEIHAKTISSKEPAPCMFEYVYFANPESVMENENIYAARLKMGVALGNKIRKMIEHKIITPDVVVPVPETSRVSAISMSEQIGVPYRELLIKNRYIQRSFILNDQKSRERAVQLKLSPVKTEIQGKKVLLVDDSIVRGTTSKRLIELVRKAGAKEVYFASACSPILHPCYYGIDFPNPDELVATNKSIEEIEQVLGADKVIYLDIGDLRRAINVPKMCMACLDGKYPVCTEEAKSFNENRVTFQG